MDNVWSGGYFGQGVVPENDKEINNDFFSIAEQFKGRYVLFAEYSYRLSSNYKLETDTSFYWYSLIQGPYDEVISNAGGPKIIERVKAYLRDGPEIRLSIDKDRYRAWSVSPTDWSTFRTIAVKPRIVKK